MRTSAVGAPRGVDRSEAELLRLGAELHDRVAQSLLGLDAELVELGKLIASDPIEARERLTPTRQIIADVYQDVRLVIGALRVAPPIHSNLAQALASDVKTFVRQTDIHTQLALRTKIVSFPKLVQLQILAILRQALSNVRQHAAATEVVVAFDRCDEGWVLTIRDNGRGFGEDRSPESDGQMHFGRRIMHERAASFGGSVSVSSIEGEGVTVTVLIPASALTLSPCRVTTRGSPGGGRGGEAANR